jgi:peptide/nickel transport system substrate-binding protein
MFRFSFSFGFVFFVSLMLLLSSCKPGKKADGRTVFRYNEASGISSLDPAFAKNLPNIWACNQIYNGLVKLDQELNVTPSIAKNWSISADGKTYTFLLRNDVVFHADELFKEGQGRSVVAQDFVYSFNRVLDKTIASPGSWVFNYVDSLDQKPAFIAVNDSVFEIILKKPFPPFLSILGMQYCSVIPFEVADFYGKDFRHHPVGAGPFQFKLWKESIKLVLVKNPSYFEKDVQGHALPYLDAVAISFLKDKQSAFLEFVKGNLDFMSGIDPNYKDELLTKAGKLNPDYENDIYLLTEPYLNTEYLCILMDTNLDLVKNSPLKLRKIRQAINYGFNRKEMIKYLRNGIGTPGNFGIIPPGLPAFDSAKLIAYDFNPSKARELLSEAGFPNGEGLPQITLATTSEYVDLCKYIQHQLSLLGFDMKINVNTSGALREIKALSKADFFRASWVADYPDAENYLSLFFSQNFAPNGPNYTHYSNPEFDSLYLFSQSITNDSLRYKIYRQLDNLMMQDAPVVILYYDQVLRFIRKNISGLGSNPVNLLELVEVQKTNNKRVLKAMK